MAQLGTKKRPAIARVKTKKRAEEIALICNEHGWHFIIGLESDKPEDISDVTRLLNLPIQEPIKQNEIERNDPCPCGSGIKYKKCCGK